MRHWDIISTPEFEAALAKLPQPETVKDTIAELIVRLELHAGEGERVDGTEWWVIRSTARGSRPGVHVIYGLNPQARQVSLIDVQVVTEAQRSSAHADTARL